MVNKNVHREEAPGNDIETNGVRISDCEEDVNVDVIDKACAADHHMPHQFVQVHSVVVIIEVTIP